MSEINLMDKYPKIKRPIEERGRIAVPGKRDNSDIVFEYKLIEVLMKFGKEYFDGDRLYGYGGYYYDPKFWSETVKRLKDHYTLKDNASVLDVGCAKGYMMHDFKKLMPNMNIRGIDISQYAYENAIADMQPYIIVGNAKSLPFPDKSFDLVISINTVDHLPQNECKQAIKEIQRVTRQNAFITVNAWRNDKERKLQSKWNITAQTAMHTDNWKKLFKEVGYKGDYWWFIPE